MCSISRDPRREEYTTCTAVAPDPVFTVRTYGDTTTPYGPRISAKIHSRQAGKPLVRGICPTQVHDREPSQVDSPLVLRQLSSHRAPGQPPICSWSAWRAHRMTPKRLSCPGLPYREEGRTSALRS